MKALHVATHMNTGGIACYISSLARALKARGVECVVASAGGDLEGRLETSGISHISLDIRTKFGFGPKVARAVFDIVNIIRQEKVDIVHAHTRVTQVAALAASRLSKTPYVTTCHGFFKPRLGRRILDAWGDKVIAISAPVRESLVRDFGVSEERIELIYNGVDLDRFVAPISAEEAEGLKRSIGIEPGSAIIGTIGRLSPVKGQRVLVEAAGDLRRSLRRIACVIIGDGPEAENLKGLAKRFGVERDLHFVRSTPDTARYLAIMDIFVLPSFAEGLGLALLEAMAASRPCIASNVGGIADIVEDGVNGALFPSGDSRALVGLIKGLLDDPAARSRIGRAGRELVRKDFSLDKMADKVQDLYKRVISSHAPK